jgi:hypothetical protein
MSDPDPDDPVGAGAATRYAMPARPGSHEAYARSGDVVVDWYDFGDHAPYESANLLIFDPFAQHRLLTALAAPVSLVDADQL